MTIDEKKAYLRQYIRLESRVNRIIREKDRWADLAIQISPVVSDMPRSTSGEDRILNSVQHIVDLEAELDRQIDTLVDLRRKIEASIMSVPDERLRDILLRRYIDGEHMEKIAIDMGLDLRWVNRLHVRALQKLTIESHYRRVL